jgi:HlyD family secretion protein
MNRKLILPASAGVLLVFAMGYAVATQRKRPELPPPVQPARTPFGETVAGAGMVEPSTDSSGTGNIAVGAQLSGAVVKVAVKPGDRVNAGDLLFALDARQTEADLKVRQAAVHQAEEQLRRLRQQPRPEDLTVSQSQVESAEAEVKLQQDLYDRMRRVAGSPAITEEELRSRELNFRKARADLTTAKANLAVVKAGAWEPDLAIAAVAVESVKAQVEQVKTTLDLLQVRAPVSGTVLQVNVRPGEYVATTGSQNLIVMGCLDPLHVRVNVDEEDIPRLKLSAPARAKVRGSASQDEIPLTFVRLEPYVVPKTSLTGVNTERVDTRVVQVIYAVDPANRLVADHKVLVGQILDVFIDAK